MKKLLFIGIIFAFFYSLYVDAAVKVDNAIDTYLFIDNSTDVEQADNTMIVEQVALLNIVEHQNTLLLSDEFDYSNNKLLRECNLIARNTYTSSEITGFLPYFKPFEATYIRSDICTSLNSPNRLKQGKLNNNNELLMLGRSP